MEFDWTRWLWSYLRFQVALVEISEGHHKTLKTETDFPEFTACESKDIIRQQKRPKAAKTIRTSKVRGQIVAAKGFLSLGLRF